MPSSVRRPSLIAALTPVVLTTLLLIYSLLSAKVAPHIPLLLGTAITVACGWVRGVAWQDIQQGMVDSVAVSVPVLFIFLMVGMTVSTWILSGTVPLMIVSGLETLSPSAFLPLTCCICALVSVFTGTSWGTVGTVGLALVGIGESLLVPTYLSAGAIVSGAWFGDKLSPLSDTTNFTAAIAGVDLYQHIKNLLPSTLPSMFVAIVIYALLGTQYQSSNFDRTETLAISHQLHTDFNLSLWVLIPPLVIAITIIKRLPPVIGVFLGVIAASVTAMLVQGVTVTTVLQVMMSGYESSSGNPQVDTLLSKGGITSMMWVISLIMIAMALGGALTATGVLQTLLQSLINRIGSRFQVVLASLVAAFGFNLASNAFIAYTLPGRVFGPLYDRYQLNRSNLSRVLEDGATMTAPLIPWNSGGVFVAGTIGVATLAYAPFAFANWLSPLFGLLWAYTGWFLPVHTIHTHPLQEKPCNDC